MYGKTGLCEPNRVCLEAVTIYAGREVVSLLRGWVVAQGYGGNKIAITEGNTVVSGQFTLDFDGLYLTVSMRVEGYTVSVVWNGISSVFIQVSSKDPSTCGLCGDNNGNLDDEMSSQNLLWSSQDLTSQDTDLFTRSWRVDSNNDCDHAKGTILPSQCSADQLVSAREACSAMFEEHVFTKCKKDLDITGYLDACTHTLCEGDDFFFREEYSVPCETGVLYLKMCELAHNKEAPSSLHEMGCPSTRFIQEMSTSLGCPQEVTPYRS